MTELGLGSHSVSAQTRALTIGRNSHTLTAVPPPSSVEYRSIQLRDEHTGQLEYKTKHSAFTGSS